MEKYIPRTFEQLRLPLRDLMRVNVEALSQLRERLIALLRSERHLGLECR